MLFAKLDEWLTNCLGVPSYKLCPLGTLKVDQLISDSECVFITAKINPDDVDTIHKLEECGFLKINSQTSYRLQLAQASSFVLNNRVKIEIGHPREIGSLIAQFSPLFKNDRFHSDTRLPPNWSNKIKENWMRSTDPEKQVLLAKIDGETAGFVLIQDKNTVIIDLIAVAPAHQGNGVGKNLIGHLIQTICKGREIVVGTQNDNQKAKFLYEKMGFMQTDISVVYHFFTKEN